MLLSMPMMYSINAEGSSCIPANRGFQIAVNVALCMCQPLLHNPYSTRDIRSVVVTILSSLLDLLLSALAEALNEGSILMLYIRTYVSVTIRNDRCTHSWAGHVGDV